MNHTLIIAEGPDDLRALHEILTRECGLGVVPAATPWFQPGRERIFMRPGQERTVHVVHTNGRDAAAQLACDYLQEGKVLDRGIDRFGLVFDPDAHDDPQWQHWVEHKALRGFTVAPGELCYEIPFEGTSVAFVPVPWDAGALLDDLPSGLRSIERVALAVMQQASAADTELVLKLLSIIQGEGRKTSWKTALRLWNALREPAVEDGFFSRAFGQDKDLRTAVRPVLTTTLLWRRLAFLSDCSAP